eukprot:6910344-Prymnesium_polylepis.1
MSRVAHGSMLRMWVRRGEGRGGRRGGVARLKLALDEKHVEIKRGHLAHRLDRRRRVGHDGVEAYM